MRENRVGSIYLLEENAEDFAYSMFRPTTEEIAVYRKCNEINQGILITETDYGFEADVDDLDLSFLKEGDIVKMELQVQISTKKKPRVYNQSDASTREAYYPNIIAQYSKMPCGSNMIWAA